MSRAAKRRAGGLALDLVEAAVHLLRTAPAGVLLSYYIGSIPCLLGLLYFWADMSRGAFARQHVLEASFTAALLFLWMKCWQAVFCSRLRTHLLLGAGEPWTLARVLRLVVVQIALQPLGLFLRPIAAQILIPYVWTYSLFQNIGVLGDGTAAGLREVVRGASRQAGLWPRQAHGALLCVFGFTLFVWLDVAVVLGFTPFLLKMFFGIETALSRNPMALLNSTTVAATVAATYLCIDPIRKSLYVLRCFHGASLRSGEDLRMELKALARPLRSGISAVALLCLLSGGASAPLRAEERPASRVEATELNGALEQVLQRREYAWRLPRELAGAEAAEKGWFTTFFEGLWRKLMETVKQIALWMEKAYRWLREIFDREPKPRDDSSRGPFNWSGTARWTLLVLLAALLVLLGLLLWRWRQGRRVEVALAQPIAAVPDLNEESVTADELPEDGWLRLARDLIDRGQLRLALRAFYLAGLAHLGHRELIQIARSKSNRDYERELRRRARGDADLLGAFGANLLTFEAAWYGEHAVTSDTLGGFSQNLDRIRAC